MNIFITGGTSGIGLSLAKHYFSLGHNVGVSSFENKMDIIVPEGIIYYQANVTDALRMKEVIEEFTSKVGSIDLIFANAGISMDKKKMPDFERGALVYHVNLIGVLNTLGPAIHIMKKQGHGHIVGIGSISGLNGLPGMAIYGASKAAIINMFESFSIDLPKYGIHSTCLVPGFIETPLTVNNKHKMPFLLTLEEAIAEITNAVSRRKNIHIFPWPLKIIALILRKLPRGIYKLIMKFDLLGLSEEE